MAALRRALRVGVVPLLAFAFAGSPDVLAQQHVVATADLQKEVVAASQTRQRNEAQVEKFFSSAQAQQALKSAHMDVQQVQKAVRSLDDEELARLAAQTRKAQNDFAAGALSNQDITYIVIALATAIIIIVIVVAA